MKHTYDSKDLLFENELSNVSETSIKTENMDMPENILNNSTVNESFNTFRSNKIELS